MKEILDKLTSYNLFNYLVPGILFQMLIIKYTHFSFFTNSLPSNLFISYITGLIISRIGSLFVEPFLKRVGFIQYSNHAEYIKASKVDPVLQILLEANNMYRTLASSFLLLILVKLFEKLGEVSCLILSYRWTIMIVSLMFIFGFAYRKQTAYIKARVDIHSNGS